MRENAIEWVTGDKIATVTLSQQSFINRVLKLAEIDSDSVEIIETPDRNNGYLVARIDVDRIKINKKPTISDEARKRMAEQLKRNFGEMTPTEAANGSN